MRAIFSSISVVGLFFLLAGCGSADSNTGSVVIRLMRVKQ